MNRFVERHPVWSLLILVVIVVALWLIFATWPQGLEEVIGRKKVFLNALFNGVTLGGLYFLVASGFTLIFGLMRNVNLAHGSIYLFGGYIGYTTDNLTGSWLFSFVTAFVAAALLGMVLQVLVFRRMEGQDLRQTLVTIGISIVLADLMLWGFGGDFYQVIPQPGRSALLVIGDVSGKGLRAAMTGTLVLGALRSLAQEALSPAQMLHRLNQQLAASSNGGFVTCLILAITPAGAVTLANAGHIPPYCNGEELNTDSSLPLGVAAEAEYAETTLQLSPGQTLTLISDGIVEAQSATGELYGFARTAAVSAQSAQAIARAAQQFGQEDDITVLTLTFVPVAAGAA